MIALMMYAGLPVVPGMIAMMPIGLLLGLYASDYLLPIYSMFNKGINYLLHELPYAYLYQPPDESGLMKQSGLGDVLIPLENALTIPTYGNALVGFTIFFYVAAELLLFAYLMIGLANAGKRVPKVKQGFEIHKD